MCIFHIRILAEDQLAAAKQDIALMETSASDQV